MKKIIVIGGCSIDYIATSFNKLEPLVSNDGSLSISFGGVSHNVVSNLFYLGHKLSFVTAIGNDKEGSKIKDHLINDLKVKLYCPKTHYPSSGYVAINGNDRDLALAIFDNRIVTEISPNYLKTLDKIISAHDIIVIDSNLSKVAIEYIVNTYYKKKKIFADCISPDLAKKFVNILDKLYFLKCNFYEAQSLAVTTKLKDKDLVKKLFKKGLNNFVVTHASQDIYYGLDNKDIYSLKVQPVKNIKNTTGCGDALFSGVVHKISQDANFHEAIKFGKLLSAVILKSDGATTSKIKKYINN